MDLHDPIPFGTRQARAERLLGCKLPSPWVVLTHLPAYAVDRGKLESFLELQGRDGEVVTIPFTPMEYVKPAEKGKPWRVRGVDRQGNWGQLSFFNVTLAWLKTFVRLNAEWIVSGTYKEFTVPTISHPRYIKTPQEHAENTAAEPIYPTIKGFTQDWIQGTVRRVLAAFAPEFQAFDEWLESAPITFWEALQRIHWPMSAEDVEPESIARQRLSRDELFSHYITRGLKRAERRRKGPPLEAEGVLVRAMLRAFGREPTVDQTKALEDIIADLRSSWRVVRLISGDVTSGKTLILALAAAYTVEAGHQTLIIVPTEILCRQHMDFLRPLCREVGINVVCLTGNEKGKTREAILEALATGRVDICVATHAGLDPSIRWKSLKLLCLDEEQRLGVVSKSILETVHEDLNILSATASPIPRSSQLALEGDWDVSELRVKPPGRQPITTLVIPMSGLDRVLKLIRRIVAGGGQIFWICAAIEENDDYPHTSVEERFKYLAAALPELRIGLIHGKLSEKADVMRAFGNLEFDILVGTTVLSIGLSIPTVDGTIIEAAPVLGISDLHQIRGRSARADRPGTCVLLFSERLTSTTALLRLQALRAMPDGWALGREDLLMRSYGQLAGTKQTGLGDYKFAVMPFDESLMEATRLEATRLLDADPTLTATPRGRAARELLRIFDAPKV
jgi:ATP-dependent DNA helicase RecG